MCCPKVHFYSPVYEKQFHSSSMTLKLPLAVSSIELFAPQSPFYKLSEISRF